MPDPKRVFVVHGRNEKARKATFKFLKSIGLEPLEWEQVVNETEKGTPQIMDVLDKGFELAQAIVVLFTADDLARLRKRWQRDDDPGQERKLTFQPRPNVLFEAGLAFGRNPSRTILVQISKSQMRTISDLQGAHLIRMDDSRGKRKALLERLRKAGCAVNDAGSEWFSEGSFDKAK